MSETIGGGRGGQVSPGRSDPTQLGTFETSRPAERTTPPIQKHEEGLTTYGQQMADNTLHAAQKKGIDGTFAWLAQGMPDQEPPDRKKEAIGAPIKPDLNAEQAKIVEQQKMIEELLRKIRELEEQNKRLAEELKKTHEELTETREGQQKIVRLQEEQGRVKLAQEGVIIDLTKHIELQQAV